MPKAHPSDNARMMGALRFAHPTGWYYWNPKLSEAQFRSAQ